MARRTIRTTKKRGAFLGALAAGNSVTASCQAAGVGRVSVYEWRHDDEAFADQWDDAVEQSVDLLEDEARRRAMAQSDTLLIFLLKSRRPSIYRPPPLKAVFVPDQQMLRDHQEAERLRGIVTNRTASVRTGAVRIRRDKQTYCAKSRAFVGRRQRIAAEATLLACGSRPALADDSERA